MPRGRAPGYDQQREQILARAAELFAQLGYTATSMNAVAEACGVSKPTLYHYVRDKDRLLAEIAGDHVARLRALVEAVEAEAGAERLSAAERLRRLIHRFVEAYADAQAAHRVLTEDVKFLPEADRERVLDGQRRVVAAFASAVAEVRPEVAAARLEKPLTMLLFGMINWMFTWLDPRGPLTHAQMAPVVADLFLGGLVALQALPDVPPPSRRRAPATTPPATNAPATPLRAARSRAAQPHDNTTGD